MSRIRITAAAAALLVAAACSTDRSPTAANPPVPADLTGSAYKLTIDVASGRITVAPPAGSGANASLSLMGSDAIALQAGTCTWTTVPANSRQKRCRFDLAVSNRLTGTDLITPTTFPQPPAGASGIVVFPLTSASLGTPSNAAVPSPDWDNAPRNFFNDFGGCAAKNVNDCYRSESYVSPLLAEETSEARTVGFDVDKNAQTVAAYIVVAADLRNATPPTTVRIKGTNNLCGWLSRAPSGQVTTSPDDNLLVGADDNTPSIRRSACSFALPADLGHVRQATLKVGQLSVSAIDPYADGNSVVVDHVDFGTGFFPSTFSVQALAANIGAISTGGDLDTKALDVTASVKDDVINGRHASQYRFRFLDEPPAGSVVFAGPNVDPEPELTITYRVP